LVRTGDDLATLLVDYGGSEADWVRANHLGKAERLEVGTLLFLPQTAKKKPGSAAPATFVVSHALRPSEGHRQVFYEVRPGDELGPIAAAFGASARELAHWNSLDLDARLREGMTLQVLVPETQDLARVRHHEPGTCQVLVAGSPEFHEYFEGLRGMRRVEVVVRSGDTLSTIGSRYGMSVGSMERVNRRSRSTKLVPGESVVVYTGKATPASAADVGPRPLEPLEPPRPELLPGTASLSP
jgi:membrane-bound lytic murein transglycosylase D